MNDFCFVGVDVAKAKFDVVRRTPTGFTHRIFANTTAGFNAFRDWLSQCPLPVWVCLESTGYYSEALADDLSAHHYRVSVINPLQIKRHAQSKLIRNKTDALDARVIAIYGENVRPRVYQPRRVEQKALRELIQLVDTLKQQLIQLKNQLAGTQLTVAKNEFKKAIVSLTKRIKSLEKKIAELVNHDEEFKERTHLLTSIVGIGRLSAWRILAYLPAIDLFENAKQLAAFVGITPQQKQSGCYRGKSYLSNYGHRRFRKALYMPALVAKHRNTSLQRFVVQLESRGLAPKAIVCAVMRKLIHWIFGILKSGHTFDESLAMGKRATTAS